MGDSAALIVCVISSQERLNTTSKVTFLKEGEIMHEEELGHSVAYGYTDDQVFSLGLVNGARRLQRWSLANATKLNNVEVNELKVYPIVARIGPTPALILDPTRTQVLYGGFSPLRPPENRQSEIGQPTYHMAGIQLNSGDFFSIDTPLPIRFATTWQHLRDRVGVTFEGGEFLLYDPVTRSFPAEPLIPVMKADTSFSEGFGVLKLARDQSLLQVASVDLQPIAPPRVLDGPFKGFRFSALTPDGTPILIKASRVGEESRTLVLVLEAFTGREHFHRIFDVAPELMNVAHNGQAWLITDRSQKKAIYFDRKTGFEQAIDFSWAERATVLVDLKKGSGQ